MSTYSTCRYCKTRLYELQRFEVQFSSDWVHSISIIGQTLNWIHTDSHKPDPKPDWITPQVWSSLRSEPHLH